MKKSPLSPTLSSLGLGLAVIALSTYVATATPYATCLTNNSGAAYFRLNQTTGTNDTVMVISSGGAVTNYIQLPSADLTQVIVRGLVVSTNLAFTSGTITNFTIAAGTFKVRIIHTGSGVVSPNSPTIEMGTIRGITANRDPASPYFGWVYVANSATNASGHGKGLFAFSADMNDILGQGNVPRNAGYSFSAASTGFSPYKLYMAPDDTILACDDADASGSGRPGNLIDVDPLLTSFSYVLAPLLTNPVTGKIGAAPVGTINNHGGIAGAWIVGSTNAGNMVLYTTDQDYQQDPTASSATEWNSIWEYDIGSGPLPWSNAPNRIIASPFLTGFAGQNQGLQYHNFGGKRYIYYNQRRSNPPQYSTYIADLDNLPAPNTYGSSAPYGMFWDSQDESYAEGYTIDILQDMMQITISSDGRWLAGIIAAGGETIGNPDGSTSVQQANAIILIPITNGVPNLPARQYYFPGGAANGRDAAFDAANNLIFGSSGLGVIQALDIGETTDATTDSAGTFSLAEPSTQVSITATQPNAKRAGPVNGTFTLTRTPDNLSTPINVVYRITGTASNGVDYVKITNNVTFAAGQTSTNITISPLPSTIPQPTLTVILTLLSGGAYSLGFPSFDAVYIADNQTPQLQILSLSTNIYQGTTNDYAALRVRRLGDTNISLTVNAANFAMTGTAVSNVDYYLANLPLNIGAGVVDATNLLIYPGLSGSSAVGSRSINVSLLAGTGYTVTNNTATTTLQLKALPPGTVLFSDDFENPVTSTANWNVLYQSYTNGGNGDYTVQFGYDYSAGDISKNLPGLPTAPHSTSGATKGLYMTVNKNTGVSAGVNVYLKNHTFSGNFALRFDLFLVRNSIGSAQSQVEDVLFGINHDGNHTNWFRNAAPNGTSLPGAATLSDGWFFDIGSDGSGGGGAPYDFAAWSAPTWTNNVSVIGPTNILAHRANTTLQVYKKPPYDIGNNVGGVPQGGTPGNTILNPTPTWSEVEISHVQTIYGNLITWKVNNTVALSFLTTNSVNQEIGPGGSYAATSGTVMVGYCDPWDDIGNTTAGQGEGCAIIDNLSVVSLDAPTIVTQPANIVAPAGTATNLSVVGSTSTGTTNYQWQLAGTNIPGANSATLTFPALSNANFGTYDVVVDDGAYAIYSSNATVLPTVPLIVTEPVSRAALQGSTINPAFSVVAQTFSQATNYQWYSNSVAIAGRTAASLSITNAQAGSFTPNTFYVTVNDGFNASITSAPPVTLTHAISQTATSSVSAGTFSLSFGTEFGPSYVVEKKTNLTDAVWTPIKTNAGTGNPVTVNDSPLTTNRFYRVRLQ